MPYLTGNNLALENNCQMACQYCGYPDAPTTTMLDLEALKAEVLKRPPPRPAGFDRPTASPLMHSKQPPARIAIVGKDPVDHPQFPDIVSTLQNSGVPVLVQTAGVKLHKVLETEPWALDKRIRWQIPLCAAEPETHEKIVGRPGHFQIAMDLLRDKRLDVSVGILLIEDVLIDDRLTRTLELVKSVGRSYVLYAFTPRFRRAEDYYTGNAPSFETLWGALTKLTPLETDSFLKAHVKTLPICAVPTHLQKRAVTSLLSAVTEGASVLNDSSLHSIEACPREAECPVGPVCLGVYRPYKDRYGTEEFQPSRVAEDAAAAVASASGAALDGPRGVKTALRLKETTVVKMAEGAVVEAAQALMQLAKVADTLPKVGRAMVESLTYDMASAYGQHAARRRDAGDVKGAQEELDAVTAIIGEGHLVSTVLQNARNELSRTGTSSGTSQGTGLVTLGTSRPRSSEQH